VLPPVSTEGLTSADVGKLAESIREDMLKALREISAPEELATAKPKLHREDSNDSTVPLTSAIDGVPSERDYGTTDSAETGARVASAMVRQPSKESELRRRVSQGDEDATQGDVSRPEASASGSTSSVGRVGKLESRDGTEDELDDEGAVLVKRP
jgi:lysophosphatidate acyltransferase